MILLLWACATETSPAPETPVGLPDPSVLDAALRPLEAPRLLRRMSLDLRGVLPTTAELDTAEADTSELGLLRDGYMEDSRFEERLVMLLGERWQSRVDEFLLQYTEYPEMAIDARNEYAWERSIGEEPLRLMAHIAATDQPWSDIVTADYTMSNEILGGIWPIERPEGEGWLVAYYTDGRPAAGVLSTNGLWWRYYSTLSNYNRGRAAAIARLLLCEDYLSRPLSFSNQVALVDSDGIEGALRGNPYCQGCHSSLDPLAATLFGFWPADTYNATEVSTYHPERELLGSYLMDVTPAYFGLPVEGMGVLGAQIAADPRFARCTAQSMAALLWRREVALNDTGRISLLQAVYNENGEQLKPLIAAITDSAVYQAGGVSGDTGGIEENTTRLMDASLLRSVIFDLTGWRWTANGFDLLDSDTYGFRILAGSVDGSQLTLPQRTPSLTWQLTLQTAAEGAAAWGVSEALAGRGTLLPGLTAQTRPQDGSFEDLVSDLHWRLFGVRASSDWLGQISQLWLAVEAEAGGTEAWKAVVAAMFQDPLFVSY